MGEQLAHAQRERLLVGQMRAQIAPVLAGPALQPGAPVIELRPLLPRQVKPEQALLRVQLQRRREIGLLVARDAGLRGDGARRARWRDWRRRRACAGRREPRPGPARARRRSPPPPRRAAPDDGAAWRCDDVVEALRHPPRRAAAPRPGRPSPAAAAATAGPAARSPAGRSPAASRLPARAAALGGAEADAERGLVGDRAAGGGERALKAFQAFLAERAHAPRPAGSPRPRITAGWR